MAETLRVAPWSEQPEDAQKGRPARPQPTNAPEAYPQGYVEDAFKVRTQLAAFFSIRLVLGLGCHARCWAAEFRW